MDTLETTAPAPCACRPDCPCDDARAEAETIRQEAETIRAQDGRTVEAAAIASVWVVRHGAIAEVVAHLYPVTLAECDTYEEARAIQERVQAWLDSDGRA